MTDIGKGQSFEVTTEVTDPTMLVLGALASKEFDFRTIQGISRETGLAEDVAQAMLVGLVELDVARRPITQTGDTELFTLSSRRPSWKEYVNRLKESLATW